MSGCWEQAIKNTHLPNPVGKYETHRYAAMLEQPGPFRNAAEKLGHELFTENGLGYMRDKMQLGVYYTDVRVLRRVLRQGQTYNFPMGQCQRRDLRFLTNKNTCPS
jgi:hypothetical protein